MMETGRKTIRGRAKGESGSQILARLAWVNRTETWGAWADRWLKAVYEEGRVQEARRALNQVKENADLCGTEALCAAGDALLRIEAIEETLNANA